MKHSEYQQNDKEKLKIQNLEGDDLIKISLHLKTRKITVKYNIVKPSNYSENCSKITSFYLYFHNEFAK